MATRSWNKAELIGNVTRDPEVRFTPSGAAVCTFSIATNRTYTSDGERKEEVDFHRIVAWNKLAELCGQLLKKGTRVFVSGRLQNRSWEGTDGQQRNATEIVIEDMIILTSKAPTSESSEETTLSDLPIEKTEPKVTPKKAKAEEKSDSTDTETGAVEEPASVDSVTPQETVNDDDLPF